MVLVMHMSASELSIINPSQLNDAAIDALATTDISNTDLSALSDQQLRRLERSIARRFHGGIPWTPVFWGIGNSLAFLTMFPLVLGGFIPLWLGFLVNTLCASIALLPSHEAQHDNIARPGDKLRWLNELVGRVSLIPLAGPYRMFKITHLGHHRFCNIPDKDPDFSTSANNALHFLWKSINNRQPRGNGGVARYVQILEAMDTPGSRRALREAAITQLLFVGFMVTMAWNGYAIEAALLWWLPRHLGFTYIRMVLSWMPHHPAKDTGRYTNTRAFKSFAGNLLTSGMEFHIVHHLYPNIPINRTPEAYWALRPILVARNCRLGDL
jgi:beta-carotene hydroxylase